MSAISAPFLYIKLNIWKKSNLLPLLSLNSFRTKFVTAKTKALAERIIAEKGFYKTPEQLTVDLNAHRRQHKAEVAEEREQLMKTVQYSMPRATKNKVEAIVFKTL